MRRVYFASGSASLFSGEMIRKFPKQTFPTAKRATSTREKRASQVIKTKQHTSNATEMNWKVNAQINVYEVQAES